MQGQERAAETRPHDRDGRHRHLPEVRWLSRSTQKIFPEADMKSDLKFCRRTWNDFEQRLSIV
jgi:hypothetical protein